MEREVSIAIPRSGTDSQTALPICECQRWPRLPCDRVKTPLVYYLSYLADAYLRSGATDKGLAVVAEGLEVADAHIDRSSLAELYRIEAELVIRGRARPGERSPRSDDP